MARNGSGTYTRVNTFVAGNTITAAGHNQNWADIETEMTNSVAADGQTTITGPIKFSVGSAALPSLTFTGDTDTGIYHSAANEVSIAVEGAKVATFGTATATFFTALAVSATAVFAAASFSGIVTKSSTSHEVLPAGTTAQRPASQVEARFRYNTTLHNPEFDNGTTWVPVLTSLAGSQMSYGQAINATVTESNSANAVTFAVKTLAGTDATSADPILFAFRNANAATGNYVYRTLTAALSLTISSGSTLGFSSGVPGRLWLVVFDDAGTVRLGAINCRSGTGIYPLGQIPRASSTAEGGSGAADSAQTFYTGTAVSSKAYVVLGYVDYESGLVTAGTWNASPDHIQLYGPGIHLPADRVQVARSSTATYANGSTAIPWDDTIPQSTEGDQILTQAITPISGANVLEIGHFGDYSSNTSDHITVALFQDSTANALMAVTATNVSGGMITIPLRHVMIAGTSSATTFKVRSGANSGGSAVNGSFGATTRKLGGVSIASLEIIEIMG